MRDIIWDFSPFLITKGIVFHLLNARKHPDGKDQHEHGHGQLDDDEEVEDRVLIRKHCLELHGLAILCGPCVG